MKNCDNEPEWHSSIKPDLEISLLSVHSRPLFHCASSCVGVGDGIQLSHPHLLIGRR